MSAKNGFQVIGNLGADVETRFTGNGTAVSSLRVAVTERQKVQGEWKDETEWFNLTLWQHENLLPHLTKGKQVLAQGRMKNRSYEKDGVKHYAIDFVVSEITLLGGGKGDGEGNAKPSSGGRKQSSPRPTEQQNGGDWPSDDGVPF